MHTSNVTAKGQVTVPAELRRAVGIKPGGRVRFRRRGRQVILEPVTTPGLETLFGLAKAPRGVTVKNVHDAVAKAVAKEFVESNDRS